MIVKLFDIVGGIPVASAHCYTLKSLKQIMDEYPDKHLKIYQYIFYMTYPNPDFNPFFNAVEDDKEELILQQIKADFSTEDALIQEAVEFCKKLYETPTSRAFFGIKNMLDKIAKYMATQPIKDGRDGNGGFILKAAKDFRYIRESYKGTEKDLMDEQKSRARGGMDTAYDQK